MSEPLVVAIQRRAVREIETIDEWWRTNRPAAPNLFANELESMLAVVALMPTLGAEARSQRLGGVRRVLLPQSRYHVYYRVRDTTLDVLAVWHTVRGRGPDL